MGLPQVLVYAVSSLEAFLKDLYGFSAPSNVEVLERFPQDAHRIREEFSKIKGDVFSRDNMLASNMEEYFRRGM